MRNYLPHWGTDFRDRNYFFSANLVFITDSHTDFSSGIYWKYELNVRNSHRRCSVKKVLFHRKTPLLKSLFNRASRTATFKKCLQHRCFPVEFAKFLRTPILKNICEWLLLKPVQISPGLPSIDNIHLWLKLVHIL